MSTVAELENLYSAVLADVLDRIGYRNQVLSSRIRGLTPMQRVYGRVFTARAIAVEDVPAEPYKLEMQAIETMQADDVFVVDVGHIENSAFWGELLSTACLAKGVRGVVMSGCTRDLWALNQLSFPVFGTGATPADSLGRLDVIEFGQPITIDGVATKNGDLVLGDLDGVVIIPSEVADEALLKANQKVSGENTVRDELAQGIPVSKVFKKHGIL